MLHVSVFILDRHSRLERYFMKKIESKELLVVNSSQGWIRSNVSEGDLF